MLHTLAIEIESNHLMVISMVLIGAMIPIIGIIAGAVKSAAATALIL